jgi:hypothetical protein
MNFKIVPDLHLPEIPGFKIPNAPELPTGKSIIRFVTDKIITNTVSNSKVVIKEGISKKYRSLTSGEILMCKRIFKDSIDYQKVKIINKAFIPKQQVPMTPLGHVHYPDGLTGSDIYQDDFSNPKFSENPIRVDGSDLRIKAKLTFIHEMSHVWQFQKGVNVLKRGLVLQTLEWTLPDSIYDPYDYKLDEKTNFKKLNPEQQANILADYYGITHSYNDVNFSSAWRNNKNSNLQHIGKVVQPILQDPKGYSLASLQDIHIQPAAALASLIFLVY